MVDCEYIYSQINVANIQGVSKIGVLISKGDSEYHNNENVL